MLTSSGGHDVIVVGGGIVAFAAARSLALCGAEVFLCAPEHLGTASSLGAGVLGPTIESAPGSAFTFACAAREFYRPFSAAIQEETGIDIQLDLAGVLRLALTEDEADGLRHSASADAYWINPQDVHELEPALAPCLGALLHYQDGIVANDRVHAALRAFARQSRQVEWTSRAVQRVQADDTMATAHLTDGASVSAAAMVIAAGAWSSGIDGLPTPPPVDPLRGQMVALIGVGLRRAVYGAGGYLTPRRDGRILAGSTVERAGFNANTTPHQLGRLESVADTLLPSLAPFCRVDSWAGLRPMSPDGLPVIDRDPRASSLLYATGHTKNGILMGPLTGEVVSALVRHAAPVADIAAFSGARFSTKSDV